VNVATARHCVYCGADSAADSNPKKLGWWDKLKSLLSL
jgi:hypothetical protein